MRVLTADNGMTILFRPMKSKIVDTVYFVKVGAIDEGPDQEGYCHALEHMLFAGTKTRTWEQITRDWEKVGACANAWTAYSETLYGVSCLKKDWEICYEVLADVLYNCTFPAERWEQIEKQAVISETQAAEDDAEFILDVNMYESLLGERYHPILGNIENIRKAKMEGLKYFYDHHYCGENIVLSVAGNLTEKQILRAVNKYDLLPDHAPGGRKPLEFDFNYNTVTVNKEDLEQCHLTLIKPIHRPKSSKRKLALLIATQALSSYLFEELREKRGLCYGAHAELHDEIPEHLFLQIKTAVDPDLYEITQDTMSQALKDIDRCFSKERIENTITASKYHTVGDSETTEESTRQMWGTYQQGIDSDPFDFKLDLLDNMKVSYIREVAERSFRGEMKFGRIIEKEPGLWTKARSLLKR